MAARKRTETFFQNVWVLLALASHGRYERKHPPAASAMPAWRYEDSRPVSTCKPPGVFTFSLADRARPPFADCRAARS